MNNRLAVVMSIILVAALLIVWKYPPAPTVPDREVKEVGTFEECVEEGNPISESYPPTCRTTSGKVLTQNIGNELVLKDEIRIDSPRPVQKVSSPLIIKGKARGGWFFEGQFNATLIDEDGGFLGRAILTAEGEWMTEEFVPYTGEIEFENPVGDRGRLILEKSNPSGIPEREGQLIVPIRFR